MPILQQLYAFRLVMFQSHAQLVLHTPLCRLAVWGQSSLSWVCQQVPAVGSFQQPNSQE